MQLAQIKSSVSFIINGLNNLLWPGVCFNCKKQITENDNFCRNCWDELLASTGSYYCRRCGCDTSAYSIVNNTCPACQGKEFHFDSIYRVGNYNTTLRDLILAFKNGRTELDFILGRLADTAITAFQCKDHIDYIVPVPIHWKRRFRRGYNQSLLISKKLDSTKAKTNTDLVRIRNTAAQTSMTSPTKRLKNVEGAFAVRKNHRFKGKTVLLVDDIKTTGATLNECAKILKHAGAEKVHTLVLAVAGQHI